MLVLVYWNEDADSKRFKTDRYYLQIGIIKNNVIIIQYNVIINGKNFYNQPIDSDLKQYEENRKLNRTR